MWWYLALAVFAAASLRLGYVDLREHRLPNREVLAVTIVVAVMLVAAAVSDTGSGGADALQRAAAAAAVYGVVFAVLWALGRGAVGAGDVKLSPVIGMIAGWQGADAAVIWVPVGIAGCGCAAVVLLLLARRRGGTRGDELAFGPVMLAGTWLGVAADVAL